MKSFANNSFKLSEASYETKLVYTFFLVFAALGMITFGLLSVGRIGFSAARIAAYYRGGEVGATIFFPKTFAVLIEYSHFHAFMVGVIFLIMAHLLAACQTGRRLKLLLITLAFASSMSDIASAWLIRYILPQFAYLLMASWIGQFAAYIPMIVLPLREMHFKKYVPFSA